ncbi:hypothetical protein NBRC116588_08100 [Pyruvatibacter sp. HU-CL02332]|uniref:beta strand repeat-containing protein n=1 Tax=Pyruvatibacter sp. HU-CL02332 TaxID=3127650 RepID=UPI00310813FB
MAILNVGTLGPYFDLQSALDAAQPGDTIIINTLNPGGGDYAHGSVWDEGITITTAVDVGTVQFGLTGGIFDVTATGPSDFIIFGNANNNILTAGDGDDLLFGAAGNDTLNGGAGADIASYIYDPAGVSINLATGTGTDGFGGTDTLNSIEALAGSQFGDTLIGDANDNYFLGLGGNDTINGGDGIDTLSYEDVGLGGGAVTVNLATGVATDGLGGTDTISGIEYVIGTLFDDTLIGDANDNQFLPDRGNDMVNGGGGVDTVSYISSTSSVVVDLGAGTVSEGFMPTDQLISIENVIGSRSFDSIWGDASDNVIEGLQGADRIDGLGGFDTASYALSLAGVAVDLSTGLAADGFGSNDALINIEGVVGSQFDDRLTGDAEANRFSGLSGDDIIDGGDGTDEAVYALSLTAYTITYQAGAKTYTVAAHAGGEGNDTLTSIELLSFAGGEPIDIRILAPDLSSQNLVGDELDNFFVPGDGDDTVDGAGGHDTVDYSDSPAGISVNLETGVVSDGHNGTDSLTSIESVIASSNADILIGSGADESFSGGDGDDIINGAGGSDRAVYALALQNYTVTFDAATGTHSVVANSGNEGSDVLSGVEYLGFNGGVDVIAIDDALANAGDDTLVGGAGDDFFLPGDGQDEIDGGDGFDTVDYSLSPSGVIADLSSGIVEDGYGNIDTLTSIERLLGSRFDDNLTGSGADESFRPGTGSDVIDGRGGDDTIDYSDSVAFVTANLLAGTAVNGVGDTHTLVSIERIIGSDFDDSLIGNSADNFFLPGRGSDTIDGAGGFDTLSFADSILGVQVYLPNSEAVQLRVRPSEADFDSFVGVEGFIGSDFTDEFHDVQGEHSFDGGDGIDRLFLSEHTESLVVDFRHGQLREASGLTNTITNIELVSGGHGDDRYVWAPGVLIVDGLHGRDTIAFTDHETAVTVALYGNTDSDADGNSFTVSSIEIVEGSSFDDHLTGAYYAGSMVIGLAGDDVLVAFGSGVGSTWASYHLDPAAVRVDLESGSATDGFGGTDSLDGIDAVEGSSFDDLLKGDLDSNTFRALAGDDQIDGRGGVDKAMYSLAQNQYTVTYDSGSNSYTVTALSGDEGTDTLTNIEILSFNGGTTDVAIADAVTPLDTTSDFDGDGDDDIVYSLTASGNSVFNNADGTGGGWIGYSDRTVIGTGDFNGDGDADLLFRFADGNHSGFDSGGGGPWFGRSDRTAVAVGDFNGDGDDDVLFQFANGNKHIADADSGNTWVGFADRSIEGVGDFDGDGDDDVLFELNAGGYVTNNVDGTGGRWLGGPNRDVAGIGDFDGDGDDDILFVLNSGGHIINDGESGGMQWFGFTDRSVAGIGDFDGDGNDDILFRLSDGNHTIISPNGVGRWIARTNNTVRDVGDYDGDGDDDILFEAPGGGFVVDQADGGAGLGMYFLDRTLVAGDPMGIGLTSDADLV